MTNDQSVVERCKSIIEKLAKDFEDALHDAAHDAGITVEELNDVLMAEKSKEGFETRWMPVYFSKDQAESNNCQGVALVNMERFNVMCVVPNEVTIGDRELKIYDGDKSLSGAEFRLWEHATIKRHVDPKWPNTFD